MNKMGYDAISASWYDLFQPPTDPQEQQRVDFFRSFIQPGHLALDIGAGTGLIALPLALNGVFVSCIENAEAMRHALLIKAAQEPSLLPRLDLIAADAADFNLTASFHLIYACWMFHNLSPDKRRRFLQQVTAHLRPEGHFILATSTTPPQPMPLTLFRQVQVGQTYYRLYMAQQVLDEHKYEMRFVYETQRGEIIEQNEVYSQGYHTSADELLALTRQAGLMMVQAFGGFNRVPYTADSSTFIGVYQRAER